MMDKDGKLTSPLPQTPDEVRELVKKLRRGKYTAEQLSNFTMFASSMSGAWKTVSRTASQCWIEKSIEEEMAEAAFHVPTR